MRIRYFVLPVLLAGSLVACGDDDDDDTTATDAPTATEVDPPAATEAEESTTEESMTGDTSMTTDGTDIDDTAVGAGSFATLVTAVQAAELEETLRGDAPFTVFAPTDDAFAKLPTGTVEDLLKPENKQKLVSILTYHVVAGNATSSDVANMKSAKTVNGKELKLSVKDGKVMVNNANVIKADVMASNGVIHVIDTVLIPQ